MPRFPRPAPGRFRALTLTGAVVALVVGLVVLATGTPVAQAVSSSGWTIVPGAPTDPRVSNLLLGTTCANSWNCWAVGGSIPNLNSNKDAGPAALTEHWDGKNWSVGPSAAPPGSQLSLLWDVTCAGGSDCWAVGAQQSKGQDTPATLAEHWDGTRWSAAVTPQAHGFLFSVSCVDASDCWATGTTVTDDQKTDPLQGFVDHWDGRTWTVAPTAASGQAHDQFNSVTCAAAADCWAVGFAGPNDLSNNFLPNVMPNVVGAQALVEHWDGSRWSVTPAPGAPAPSGTYLASVTCTSATRCWAVGSTMTADGNPASTLVDRWDGSAWTTVASPDPSAFGNLLTDVTCSSPSACWATGAVSTGDGKSDNNAPNPLIETWGGGAWTVDPSPNVSAFGYLNGVACAGASGCTAVGFAISGTDSNKTDIQALTEQMVSPPAAHQGLWLSASDGGVFSFGDASFHGSLGALHLNAPIVGMAATPDGNGYWLVASDGGVFSFGDASFHGSLGALHLNAPIVGMAATPDGNGYWLVASDGGVFSFGDASFHGSLGALHLNAPIVGMAATPDGNGYWLVASDGGVFSFGDASFHGSLGALHLNAPIVGMAATPDGNGYWLVASDGGVFNLGDAGYDGSVPGQGIADHAPVDGMAATPDGRGYWLVGTDGAVYAYGDAAFVGSLVGLGLSAPVTGVASAG